MPSIERDFIPVENLTGGDRECDERPTETSRRRFLELMGASLALAGASGCTRQPPEFILPYVEPPEHAIPGRPRYYATAVPAFGGAEGVIVETHLGRPTKVEGNPAHPASLGAASVRSQASVLDLYDPDRAREVTYLGSTRTWDDFLSAFRLRIEPLRPRNGAGFRLLTETVCSPSLGAQIQAVLTAFPEAVWHQYEPAGDHSARAGAQLAFGRPLNCYFRLDHADVILALDSDFLACGRNSTRMARDFATRRRQGNRLDMNRLYAVECTVSATGGKADHRLPVRYSEVESVARELTNALTSKGAPPSSGKNSAWIVAAAQDLLAHRGRSAIIAGEQQSPVVHALAHQMNAALGNVGKTVNYTEPLEVRPEDEIESLRALMRDMDAGGVEVLLIVGGNPVYNAPADLAFAERLRKVKTAVHAGLHFDETSQLCDWHVPASHFFEEWSDSRAFDGTVTILQPMIEPLYETRSILALLDGIRQYPPRSSYEIVRAYWAGQHKGADFEAWWRKSVCDGLVADSAMPPIEPGLTAWQPQAAADQPGGPEVVFRPDPYIHDGSWSNNNWLQELPRPITKLTWDNAVHLSPTTARNLSLKNEDLVRLRCGARSVEGAVWISQGQPDDSVTVHLGFGRTRGGRAANGAGFNAYLLRTSDAMWAGAPLAIDKTGRTYRLATTQPQQEMAGRDLILENTPEGYRRDPDFVSRTQPEPPKDESLYPTWRYAEHAWGMSIDLTACVNCNACVAACQAENNIPVVGKEEVLRHRAMHWIRIDTYYKGDPERPTLYYQPVPCMQCENAPCELVCPVQATNHSSEGLNDMVYNRCVGTRYCSNNCPYKVRRFNFFLFQDWVTESIKMQRNPDVSVRSRGVMEKCTYCVQRIREAEIRATTQDRRIREGEIQTACQQSCPTQAIVFGDINRPDSQVSRLKAEKLNYALLAELNTRPRTTYLAELRNPNPVLKGEGV